MVSLVCGVFDAAARLRMTLGWLYRVSAAALHESPPAAPEAAPRAHAAEFSVTMQIDCLIYCRVDFTQVRLRAVLYGIRGLLNAKYNLPYEKNISLYLG